MYKSWSIKFVKDDGEYSYARIIAKTLTTALKYAEEKGYGTIDQVEYASSEAVDIAE